MKIVKQVTYFFQPGSVNTKDLITLVGQRLKENKIKHVVVASNSGQTALAFARELSTQAKIIAVSYESMNPEYKQEIIKLNGIVLDRTHRPFRQRSLQKVRETFFTLGQGFKVAVEVILIAADKKAIPLYQDVIGVGGTGQGADTAIIARSTPTKKIFSSNRAQKLEIRELLAMPLKKKWW